MDDLLDLVKIYDDVLEPEICGFLVNAFDNLEQSHERIENDRKPNFTQLNLTECSKTSPELDGVHQYLIKKTFEHRDLYYEFIDKRCFPDSHAFEQFRIKKYKPDGNDAFDCHVDVMDHPSARRFLAFLWYLNDVDEGGETVFKDLEIKPKTGKLLVFPPMWMFPHIGKPPISGEKYILSTYLHYK